MEIRFRQIFFLFLAIIIVLSLQKIDRARAQDDECLICDNDEWYTPTCDIGDEEETGCDYTSMDECKTSYECKDKNCSICKTGDIVVRRGADGTLLEKYLALYDERDYSCIYDLGPEVCQDIDEQVSGDYCWAEDDDGTPYLRCFELFESRWACRVGCLCAEESEECGSIQDPYDPEAFFWKSCCQPWKDPPDAGRGGKGEPCPLTGAQASCKRQEGNPTGLCRVPCGTMKTFWQNKYGCFNGLKKEGPDECCAASEEGWAKLCGGGGGGGGGGSSGDSSHPSSGSSDPSSDSSHPSSGSSDDSQSSTPSQPSSPSSKQSNNSSDSSDFSSERSFSIITKWSSVLSLSRTSSQISSFISTSSSLSDDSSVSSTVESSSEESSFSSVVSRSSFSSIHTSSKSSLGCQWDGFACGGSCPNVGESCQIHEDECACCPSGGCITSSASSTGCVPVTCEWWNPFCTPVVCSSSLSSESSVVSISISSSSISHPSPGECTDCQRCGEGFFNVCDEQECLSLGPCVYQTNLITRSCLPDPICFVSSSSSRRSRVESRDSSSSSILQSSSSTSDVESSSSSSSSSSQRSMHFVCNNDQCALVSGPGVDQCRSREDCLKEVHMACFGKACTIVLGPGLDLCANDSDCQTTHRGCFGEQCVEMSGVGEDSCSSFKDCAPPLFSSLPRFVPPPPFLSSFSRAAPRISVPSSVPTLIIPSISSFSSSEKPVCGDGSLDHKEECDDGNTVNNDGCSRTCQLEVGFCGDGVVQTLLGEQCEPFDSARDDTLVCSSRCRYVLQNCGDGIKDLGEECDKGEQNADLPDSLCRTDCSLPRCGDGILDKREECDDGNNTSQDGCDLYCTLERFTLPPPIVSTDIPTIPFAFRAHVQKKDLRDQILVSRTPSLPAPRSSLPAQPNTGPTAIAIMAGGAAVGIAYMRRKRRK